MVLSYLDTDPISCFLTTFSKYKDKRESWKKILLEQGDGLRQQAHHPRPQDLGGGILQGKNNVKKLNF